jgi:hypothetical protein
LRFTNSLDPLVLLGSHPPVKGGTLVRTFNGLQAAHRAGDPF